ncbi:hypothetical protein AQUSIP_17040 [Aquicella siphonis]|uniref:Uncharacterized protein n=1 Tax=Aquicella siphonis TaxID=254247 RepID=A0A5E4PJ35_9COXI|nr:hypothetical protein AQUSIP_17040 [Aquicella siphonis]
MKGDEQPPFDKLRTGPSRQTLTCPPQACPELVEGANGLSVFRSW